MGIIFEGDDMDITVKLSEKEVKEIIANHFKQNGSEISVDDISVSVGTMTEGYGLSEQQVARFDGVYVKRTKPNVLSNVEQLTRGNIMRVYERKNEYEYRYPEEMKLILDYLNEHGKILVDGRTIESLYEDFSDECYCAGWMCIDEHILEEFENWLNEYE